MNGKASKCFDDVSNRVNVFVCVSARYEQMGLCRRSHDTQSHIPRHGLLCVASHVLLLRFLYFGAVSFCLIRSLSHCALSLIPIVFSIEAPFFTGPHIYTLHTHTLTHIQFLHDWSPAMRCRWSYERSYDFYSVSIGYYLPIHFVRTFSPNNVFFSSFFVLAFVLLSLALAPIYCYLNVFSCVVCICRYTCICVGCLILVLPQMLPMNLNDLDHSLL